MPSMSTTKMPDTAPVAIATLQSGCACHHARITSVSVLASRQPCGVAGRFSRGMQGKTAMRRFASASAAPIMFGISKRSLVVSGLLRDVAEFVAQVVGDLLTERDAVV